MRTSKKLRVKVIEDEQVLSGLFEKVLKDYGCSVQTFPDPSTACVVFSNPECECFMESPCTDVLITDMRMPKMNGLELLRLQQKCGCKALHENKALMSAITTPKQQAAIQKLGCHFFQKPFKLAEIEQWISDCAKRVSDESL